MQWFVICGYESLGSEPQSLHYCQGERNRGYALLMKVNKPGTVLYRAPTFSLLLASHGGVSACMFLDVYFSRCRKKVTKSSLEVISISCFNQCSIDKQT